jgi:D-proline reductase (dithiol) PrdA
MSMSAEYAETVKNEVAAVCCRTEEGTVITPENLEDPAIFPDLEDSGLMNIPDNCLKIGEVIGAKLTKTIDSLTPITPDIVEGAKAIENATDVEVTDADEKAVLKFNKNAGDVIKPEDLENPMHFEKLLDSLLIDLNDSVLTRGEVVGKKLAKDVVALTPVTGDMIEGFVEKEAPAQEVNSTKPSTIKGGVVKIKIGEGKNINIEIPVGMKGKISVK